LLGHAAINDAVVINSSVSLQFLGFTKSRNDTVDNHYSG